MAPRLLLIFIAIALVAPACDGGVTGAVTGAGKVTAPRIQIPDQILGLKVTSEDVTEQVEEVERPYLDAVSMFSLREEDLLRATFQVSRFNRLGRPGSASFRRQVTAQMGGSVTEELRVEDLVVYTTSGAQQNVYAWIEDRGFFVLSVHEDFEFPRTLLRRVVNLNIEL